MPKKLALETHRKQLKLCPFFSGNVVLKEVGLFSAITRFLCGVTPHPHQLIFGVKRILGTFLKERILSESKVIQYNKIFERLHCEKWQVIGDCWI